MNKMYAVKVRVITPDGIVAGYITRQHETPAIPALFGEDTAISIAQLCGTTAVEMRVPESDDI